MELLQDFTALDDDGNEYRLKVYQENVPAGTRDNPSAVIPGLKRIVTDDGESVNRVRKGVYKIVASGTVVRSSDPGAP